jgi:hypothetical protein
MTTERISRGEVWERLGRPTDQIGSVNDPRTYSEHGLEWNEKWVYRVRGIDGGEQIGQIVLWNRYDLLGIFRVAADGSAESIPLPDE